MHIVNCLHPRIVVNPDGEHVRVRCGHCSACLNARSKKWVNKLTVESQYHRYAFMVNLTYDNVHLPKLFLDPNDNLRFANRRDNLCIPFSELEELINSRSVDGQSDDDLDYTLIQREKDLQLLKARLNHSLGLPVCSVRDVQLFIKRLNKWIHDNITKRYSNFRYFICHEYGPTTFRPHCHGVFYFDEPRLEARFSEAISATWKNGDSSAANIFSNGGFSYVAQYVNMFTHLPAFYTHKDLRPKYQFSKCPPLGFDSLPFEELRDIYNKLPTTRTFWDSTSAGYVTLPVNSTFKDRYFPKFTGYYNFTDSCRIGLYRAVEKLPSSDFNEFSEACYQLYRRYKDDKLPISKDFESILIFIRGLHMNSAPYDSVNLKLYKLYRVSSRFCFIRDSLGFSSEYMYHRIDEFYKKLDYERLRDMYSFQSSYVQNGGLLVDLLGMYPDFIEFINTVPPSEWPVFVRNALESFHYDGEIPFDVTTSLDYRSLAAQSDRIYKDTHKSHEKNNYLYSEKFFKLDSELQKIMISYAS